MSAGEGVQEIESECRSGALGCGDCKQLCAAALVNELTPIRERAAALRQEPERVREILMAGAARARRIAEETMQQVRAAMGMTTTAWR